MMRLKKKIKCLVNMQKKYILMLHGCYCLSVMCLCKEINYTHSKIVKQSILVAKMIKIENLNWE